jgi:hypothetical protein
MTSSPSKPKPKSGGFAVRKATNASASRAAAAATRLRPKRSATMFTMAAASAARAHQVASQPFGS